MNEFLQSMAIWTYGLGQVTPDGTTTAATLPDGSRPLAVTAVDGIPWTPAGGLAQQVASPTGDLGFGRDLVCWDDLTPDFQEVDPHSTYAVAQDAYHRLCTPRGLIPDDPSYGTDVLGLLQRAFGPNGPMETKGRIVNELSKDDRIDLKTLQVQVDPDAVNSSLNISVFGNCTQGPFSLVMTASNSGLLLNSLTGST